MHFQPGVCPAPLIGWPATPRARSPALRHTSLLLPLHPPEEIAAEIASLDQLSGGRLLIGLGRGFQKPMLEAFGVPPAEKRDRFDEALDRILALWRDHNARDESTALQTAQRPHPPLAVAAFGPKGLAQAARRALPYLASPVETFDQRGQPAAIARAPDPGSALKLALRTVFVHEDPRCSRRHAPSRGRAGGPAQGDARPSTKRWMRRSTPVRSGTPDFGREADRAAERLDLDLLVARPSSQRRTEDAERSLRLLAEEVWPAVVAAS